MRRRGRKDSGGDRLTNVCIFKEELEGLTKVRETEKQVRCGGLRACNPSYSGG